MQITNKTRTVLALALGCLQEGVLGGGEWPYSANRNARTYLVDSGHWGDWTPMKFADYNYFVCGFKLRVESNQHGEDDSGLNGLIFKTCHAYDWGNQRDLVITRGHWGDWNDNFTMCPRGMYIASMGQLTEAVQSGNGDDTAANNINAWCGTPNNVGSRKITGDSPVSWGTWSTTLNFREGNYFVYAARARVESDQGNDDDTAFNGLKIRTAQWKAKPALSFEARWVDIASFSQGVTHKYAIGVATTKSDNKKRQSMTVVSDAVANSANYCVKAEVGYSASEIGGFSGSFSNEYCGQRSTRLSRSNAEELSQSITQTSQMSQNQEGEFECENRPGFSVTVWQWQVYVPSQELTYKTRNYKCTYGGLTPQCPKAECVDEECQICSGDTRKVRAARQCYTNITTGASRGMTACSAAFKTASKSKSKP